MHRVRVGSMGVGRILVPVDFSEASKRGLDYALGAAKAYGADVEILHASSLPPYVPTSLALSLVRGDASLTVEDLARSQAKEQMDGLLATVAHNDVAISPVIEAAAAFDAIKGRSDVADLVIM